MACAARRDRPVQVEFAKSCDGRHVHADARKLKIGWELDRYFKVMATVKGFLCLLLLSVSVHCSPETLVPFIAWSNR